MLIADNDLELMELFGGMPCRGSPDYGRLDDEPEFHNIVK